MKNLFVLNCNLGDGSSCIKATFDAELIKEMEDKYNIGELEFETWCDGDGFHYETWTVPDECTPENMGFTALTRRYVF
jgi:hypothetical protein